ncbi:metallophosphoesterase [Metabacillus iocasae]|uniref:Serine/threonine protein phosphatase 1 n=1 Tax=Priestia iocasae TaxID=2291674 RepID=A0ABS2QWL4_9BACI|nr:metallophosphoesterase [Metabacillus iocasae]MBM7703673.1 serine/threonine protein phosphatase 1 [Metabacillus iocasae]
MRRFVISDIHGSYNEMMRLFEYVKLNPGVDQLVVVGDMINRGPDSGPVLKEIHTLEQSCSNVHVTIGNHEEMMLWYVGEKSDMWTHFGGRQAAESINLAFRHEGASAIVNWVRQLPLTYEDEAFIYSHAGFQLPYHVEKINRNYLWQKKKEFYAIDKKQLLSETDKKCVVHGHTPTTRVTHDGARIAIDLGAQVTTKPKLALVELEEELVYVYDFYTKTIKIEQIKKTS